MSTILCAWPACRKHGGRSGFCSRDAGRLRTLGFDPDRVRRSQLPEIVVIWNIRELVPRMLAATALRAKWAGTR